MPLSADVSINTPETVSTRRVEKVKGSHLFKNLGYSLEKGNQKGKFLESAIFSVGGYDWSIRYYPNGETRTKDDYTSIFIFLKSEAECVQAQPSFIMLNQDGHPLSEGRTVPVYTFSSDKDYAIGLGNFVKRSAFVSLIKDDCLVIRCTVTVFKAFPAEVEPVFPLLVPPPDVQLSHLLEDGYGVDVTFEVNGQTFNAHKCILASRSQVFRAQFYGLLKEKSDTIIKIEDMEAPVFKTLLHYIYYQTVPEFEESNEGEKKHNTKLMAEHLLVAADRYGLERLKIICESILYGSIY
ncbi:BTB/POZ/MATH-domain protein [Rhynchospora pubera]|uniref:BTB/POZ/MATH-domain protein n=1 Tax=Rhynchospora pubera TaxID=906938 RepID=A0AAV8F8H6_9POAL|nr:BTB/POZ/MATH-domain protein [Rhynchospora pubera]KAJ4809215.1 BTB/POZ/MATH-domain protein [Rhynchospora pubera]